MITPKTGDIWQRISPHANNYFIKVTGVDALNAVVYYRNYANGRESKQEYYYEFSVLEEYFHRVSGAND